MHPYLALVDLHSMIPPEFLTQALDDDGDGNADSGVFDKVAEDASSSVDARLGQRYKVPFSYPFPALVSEAAKVFAAEMLYARRGKTEEKNPWSKQAENLRKKLDRIASGTEALGPGFDRAKPSASVIVETAKTTSKRDTLTA